MNRRSWHSCQPMDLHNLARQWFVAARRIELQKLAVELGISRATAYRWAGSAEQLVGEVLASILDDTFTRLAADTEATGTERVVDVLVRGMRYAHGFQPLKKFLEKDPQLGLKIVASPRGPVQARTMANIERLLGDEAAAGNLTLPAEAASMALALSRVVESYLYSDLITGSTPDYEEASGVLRLMLREA